VAAVIQAVPVVLAFLGHPLKSGAEATHAVSQIIGRGRSNSGREANLPRSEIENGPNQPAVDRGILKRADSLLRSGKGSEARLELRYVLEQEPEDKEILLREAQSWLIDLGDAAKNGQTLSKSNLEEALRSITRYRDLCVQSGHDNELVNILNEAISRVSLQLEGKEI